MITEMIDQLRAGLISPQEATSSPVISAWAAEAIAEQPRLRQRVQDERATVG
jgi:hypothetical protein